MSDVGDDFRAWKQHRKDQKAKQKMDSIDCLNSENVPYKQLSEDHLRVGEYDFWPSTELFIHTKTKKRGVGVMTLIGKVKK